MFLWFPMNLVNSKVLVAIWYKGDIDYYVYVTSPLFSIDSNVNFLLRIHNSNHLLNQANNIINAYLLYYLLDFTQCLRIT